MPSVNIKPPEVVCLILQGKDANRPKGADPLGKEFLAALSGDPQSQIKPKKLNEDDEFVCKTLSANAPIFEEFKRWCESHATRGAWLVAILTEDDRQFAANLYLELGYWIAKFGDRRHVIFSRGYKDFCNRVSPYGCIEVTDGEEAKQKLLQIISDTENEA